MATSTSCMALGPVTSDNRLEFLPLVRFLPAEWATIGQVFAQSGASTSAPDCRTPRSASPSTSAAGASLTGKATFVLRQGYDPLDRRPTGRLLEGDGDLGIALRLKTLALGMQASALALRAGLDDPLAAGAAKVGTAPSLKATLAKEFAEDSFVGVSYDLKMRKPELSLCWTGETFTEKATLCLQADPIHRTLKVAGAVSFPGPDWRDTVYDENRDVIEVPRDDGARHRLWVRHEARHRDLLHKTALGATFDLGRIVNLVCSQVDYRLEPKLPPLFWALPFSQRIYNLLVPAEDENQVHHHIKGWDLDTAFEFGRRGPTVALRKHLRHCALSASWDAHAREAGLEYAARGLRLGATLGRVEGMGWKQPALYLHVEPLALLG